MRPRIYLYKITFEEIPDWYWGFHKEKRFGEVYLGSPKTHSWKWEFYTPHLQICQEFEYSDEGYRDAREVESKVISRDLNNPFCLNENAGGSTSLKTRQRGGLSSFEKKVGIHSITAEDRREIGKRSAAKQTREDKIKGGRSTADRKVGVCGRSKEKMSEDGKKGGRVAGLVTSKQVWVSLVDGYRGSAAVVARHNKHLGWDPSARVRVF
jgi:hypothetical protein